MKDEIDFDELTYQSPDDQKYRELMEENKRRIKSLTATLSDMKKFAEQLEKKSEKQRLEYEEENSTSLKLRKAMEELQKDNRQKNNLIRELTVKLNRRVLDSNKEFDVVMEKLKEIRIENVNLKVDILKLQEENENLANENFCLKESMKILDEQQQRLDECESSVHESSEEEEEEDQVVPQPQKEADANAATDDVVDDDYDEEEEIRTVDIDSESDFSESKLSLED